VFKVAHMKKCPYCKGFHRKKRAYLRCKRAHKPETWPK
jgi:transposase-like protein